MKKKYLIEQDVKQFSADKILKHLDRVAEWQKTGDTFPVTVEIDLTNVCNNKCPRCFGFFGNDKSSMDRESARSIIKQIREMGGRGLTFTGGGEPTCNPHLAEAIQYAKDLGFDVALITNGLSLSEEDARTCVNCCTWLRVSLDAGSPEIYTRTHGMDGKAFERTVENTRMLVRLKRETKSDCTIGVGYLTDNGLGEDMYRCTRLCKEIGVDYIQFRPFLRRYGEEEIDYDFEDVLPWIAKCSGLAGDGFDVLFSKHKYDCMQEGDTGRNYGICYGHYFATTIGADQKVYICCHMRGVEKYCLGDLRKNTLKEIWNSEQRKRAYSNIDFRDCPPLCRCNTFNQVLWNIAQNVNHKNFL
jgi:MoaA/NifB/PqqE/SkfB family radical SAM enzyme